jgi:hypothetical protein
MDRAASRRWLIAGAIVAALVIGFAIGSVSSQDVGEPAVASATASASPLPDKGTPEPTSPPASSSAPTGVSSAPSGPVDSPIRLTNLTTGTLYKEAVTTSVSTEPITVGRDSLGLLHLMSCCDHSGVPRVTGPGGPWTLAVTHETGEKRHWVFQLANEGPPVQGAIRVSFERPQDRVLWIVDEATGVDLGNEGADAIVQSAWQDSKANDDAGQIALQPFEDPSRNMGVAFVLAGSGTATNIDPERGATETAEAEVGGSSLIIDTFWEPGEDGSLAVEFVDDAGNRAVQSWLMLAVELRAAPGA